MNSKYFKAKKKSLLRRFYLWSMNAFFSVIPLKVAIWIAKKKPRKTKYLPPNRKFIINNYLGNIKIEVNTSFPIERTLISGSYDPIVQHVIKTHVRKGDTAMDIGANVGAISLALALKTGVSGKTFCIEPGPENHSKLLNNFKLNPSLNSCASIHQLGLSDKEGSLKWSEDINNLGNATLLSQEGIEVPVTTLDKFCITQKIDRLDFIKIDVEGMEYEVIKGGENSIKLFKPIIFFETSTHFEEVRQLPLFDMILELLSGWGYEVVEPMTLSKITSTTSASNDVLARPISCLDNQEKSTQTIG